MQRLDDVLSRNPHLTHIKTSVHDIPERLKEYDSSLFLVYNAKKNQVEIHSLENRLNTYCFKCPYPELDSRLLEMVRRGDMKGNGMKYMYELLNEEEKQIAQNEKDLREYTKDFAREHRSLFAKAKDELGL